MKQQQPGAQKKAIQTETLKQRVATFFDELELAAGWQRPSILVATYRSRLVLMEAQAALEKKLQKVHQRVYHVRVGPENDDIAVFLAQFPDRETTTFFISDLLAPDAKVGVNTYRSLNIRRELLVDYHIRAVFWLSEQEAENLPVYAPDFWAFRHRMIEFLEPPTSRRVAALVEAFTPSYWDVDELLKDNASKIATREELLALIPDGWKNGAAMRVELLIMLAGLHWAKGETTRAINHLKSALELAQKIENKVLQSDSWVGLGLVLQNLNRFVEAETAFQTAVKLNLLSAHAWRNLGNIHQQLGRAQEALLEYKKSTDLDPKIAPGWNKLGDLLQLSGDLNAAAHAYQHAARINPGGMHAWQRLAEIYKSQGRLKAALPAYKMLSSLMVDDAGAWINLGLCYRDAGLMRSAIRAFYKAARCAAHDPLPWKNLGDIYRKQGQLRYARKAYKTAILLDPQDQGLLSSLKTCYPAAPNT